jgi:hypothetical protein
VFASLGVWFISRYEITRSLQVAEIGAVERIDAATGDS